MSLGKAIQQARQRIHIYGQIQSDLRQQNGNRVWKPEKEKRFLELVSKKAALRSWLERAEHIYRIESSKKEDVPSDPNDGIFLAWAA